jgi:hypothetical protein
MEGYEASPPSRQTAVDVFRGEWVSRLPDSLESGDVDLFAAEPISWLTDQVPIAGASVLELGPLEGGHSYMLHQQGASRIVAVEANRRAYLKCLIVKEVFGLDRVKFLCGDLVEYLRASDECFDLCLASGVLYHMRDPVEMLQLAAQASDRLYLWTHYYDQPLIQANTAVNAHFPSDEGPPYRYEYGAIRKTPTFCGGGEGYSYWLDRATIIELLGEVGFGRLEIGFDHRDHPNGPAFAILARR